MRLGLLRGLLLQARSSDPLAAQEANHEADGPDQRTDHEREEHDPEHGMDCVDSVFDLLHAEHARATRTLDRGRGRAPALLARSPLAPADRERVSPLSSREEADRERVTPAGALEQCATAESAALRGRARAPDASTSNAPHRVSAARTGRSPTR